jgi:hypothetical protein
MISYNLKTLAKESGLSYKCFLREFNILMSDEIVRKEFGSYRNRLLSKKQLKILVSNISYIEHIKID